MPFRVHYVTWCDTRVRRVHFKEVGGCGVGNKLVHEWPPPPPRGTQAPKSHLPIFLSVSGGGGGGGNSKENVTFFGALCAQSRNMIISLRVEQLCICVCLYSIFMLNGFVVPDRLTVLFKKYSCITYYEFFQVVEIIEGGYDIPPSQSVSGGGGGGATVRKMLHFSARSVRKVAIWL